MQTGGNITRCSFSPSATGVDSAVHVDAGFEDTITLVDAVSLPSGGTVNFQCTAFVAAHSAFRRVIEAVRVGTLTAE